MLCLSLGVVHPDYLADMLSEDQINGWRQYYLQKPFGHWIESTMIAKLAAMWSSNVNVEDMLPKVELIGEKDEDQIMIESPGFGGAEEFLRSLQRGNH